MTTAIIADDHEIVRRGLRGILEADGNIRVVAEAADGLAAAQLVDKYKPTLLILDLNMPGLEGTRILELVRKRKELTHTKVLLLSSTEPQELDRIAIESGFDAALHKSASKADLVSTITALMGRTLA